MDEFNEATIMFFTALLFSMLIERLLEVLKSAYDLLDSSLNLHSSWTRRAYRIRDRAERRLRVFDHVDPAHAAPILSRFSEMLVGAGSGHSGSAYSRSAYSGEIPILSGDLVRALYMKGAMKIVGMGIGLAFAFSLDLNIFTPLDPDPGRSTYFTVLTGIGLGLGSGVMHKLINGIEKARRRKAAKGGAA